MGWAPELSWGVVTFQDTRESAFFKSLLSACLACVRQPPVTSEFYGVDGTDPEAFIAAMEKFVGQRVTPEIRERILGNDIQALAAATHDRDSQEDVMPTMTMPCFLYVGEADPRFPKVQACVKSMPNATFVSIPDLNHSQTNMRSDLVLPHVTKFLSEYS